MTTQPLYRLTSQGVTFPPLSLPTLTGSVNFRNDEIAAIEALQSGETWQSLGGLVHIERTQ